MGFQAVVFVKAFPLMINVGEKRVIPFLGVRKSKFNFELFWKEIKILECQCCSTREDLSIYVSITNV